MSRIHAVVLVCMSLASAGCGETQISPANRRLVESLATAASARNPEWLSENVRLIEQRRAAEMVPDAEYQAFRKIVVAAEAGKWEEAERLAFALRDAQRPWSEDAAAVESRTLPRHDDRNETTGRPRLRPRPRS